MEDMRKRPGTDVTSDDASSSSSSPSAKRRRGQASEEAADISTPPAANDVVSDSGDVISAPTVAHDNVGDSDAVISASPLANGLVMDDGDVTAAPAVNGVVANRGGDVSVAPTANDVVGDSGVISALSAAIGDVSVVPAVNDVVANNGGDVLVPPPANGVVADRGGDILIAAAEDEVVLVPPAVNNSNVVDDISDFSVPDAWPAFVNPRLNGVVTARNDEALSELTRLLDLSNSTAAPETSFTFSENPFRSPRVFQTMSTSYVTINGNEESCGSSFSDNDSSVMASVARDERQRRMGGHDWYNAAERSRANVSPWDMDDTERWAREVIQAPELDEEWDDAALARFLGEEDLSQREPFSGSN